MARYIDADLIKKKAFQYYDESFKVDIEDVDSIPTADAAPVRHGKWVNSYISEIHHYRCSVCGEYTEATWHSNFDYNYCPNCGAKMDLV